MAQKEQSNTSLTSEDSGTDENPVSMLDVLADEKKLEEDANAVLGDSDDKNCTYFMGYVRRQALYSCLSCVGSDAKQSAGVCLACSLECHEGHDLVELYTKRFFRCDCGNTKFGKDFKCKLAAIKSDTNPDNKYNQNFAATYCSCARPYPDPEDDVEDDMLQCIVCEDWYHGRHLNNKVPEDEEYDEMICSTCMDKCDFLWSYSGFCVGGKGNEAGDSGGKANGDVAPKRSPKKSVDDAVPGTSKTKDAEILSCKKVELEKNSKINKHNGATFWPEQWRQKLCKCFKCVTKYDELKVAFLMDENDSIKAYEERGKAKAVSTQYEGGMQALSGMDRHQQVEMLHGFNDMKSELTDYLRKFAENGKVVREEDIKEFFQQLQAKKKQRTTEPAQYFCK